ncbi:MAG: phenol hydroxylase [Gammaproteobacteria bacterium]|nr:MAG: phenol hydroxylase [Gammaproteobacteria bacterium]
MNEFIKVDTNKRYVHITGIRNNNFIEFDFSISEPGMYVELILPFDAFQIFCANNQIMHLTSEQAAEVDYDRLKWRYGQPGIRQ